MEYFFVVFFFRKGVVKSRDQNVPRVFPRFKNAYIYASPFLRKGAKRGGDMRELTKSTNHACSDVLDADCAERPRVRCVMGPTAVSHDAPLRALTPEDELSRSPDRSITCEAPVRRLYYMERR